jgi:soluble lytic murein transglycosylase-like protein
MGRHLILFMMVFVLASARADCFDGAATRFATHPDLLRAMGEQESNLRPDALGPVLDDGNRALGLMQVNSIHLPELARYGIKREDLMNGCVSVYVGAWLFARDRSKVGDTWKAVGVYNTGRNSKNTDAQARYIAAVRRRFERIQSGRRREAATLVSAPVVKGTAVADARAMTVWEAE